MDMRYDLSFKYMFFGFFWEEFSLVLYGFGEKRDIEKN